MTDPFAKPAGYDEIMAYLLAHPGIESYAAAEAGYLAGLEASNRQRPAAGPAPQQSGPDLNSLAMAYAQKNRTSLDLARVLVKQTHPNAVDRFKPAHHDAAIQYMSDNWGTSYEDACRIVQDGERAPAGDLLAKAMETPAYHDAAVAYMWANPGMEYEAAVDHVTGR